MPGEKASPPAAALKPGVDSAALDWKPDNIEVICAANKCPLQVGVLIFAGPPVDGMIPIQRCTAFLIAEDKIMSNGHCDSFEKSKGYFISQPINGKKEIREIVGVSYKRLTSIGRPDVVVLQLNEAIDNLPPLRLASGPQLEFKKLIVFAVMPESSPNKFPIQKHECTVRRHEFEFPYDIGESPDMIRSFGCRLRSGTSGSPMFAAGSEEVQAIQVGGVDPGSGHWSSLATNVRCLDLPGSKPGNCTVVDSASTLQRFEDIQRTEAQKLQHRRISKDEDAVRLRPTAYQLSAEQKLRFEVIHWPECRRSAVTLSAVPLIIEQVALELDEWAMPKIHSLSEVTIAPAIKAVSGNIYDIEVEWPTPAGSYLQPDLDLRKKWGSRFAVDIPICTR